MSSIDDMLREIVDTGRDRDAIAYREFVDGLAEADQRILAAHTSFALLHALMAKTADVMRKAGLPATLTRPFGFSVSLALPAYRAAVCTCMLADDSIVVDLFTGPHCTREVWRPPVGLDNAKLLPAVVELGRRIAVHLNGR